LLYDVFGFCPQILQGADLLAYGKGDEKFQVFIPDFLEGNLANAKWFEPDATPAMKGEMGKLFSPGGGASVDVLSAKLLSVTEEVKGSVEKIGVLGYCWGAKIVCLTAKEGTPFTVAGGVHPSAMAPEDAPPITIPIIILASGDEDADTVTKFGKGLKVPNLVDFYSKSPHGWMTTRADLKDEQGRADFEKGYETVLSFFIEHMT